MVATKSTSSPLITIFGVTGNQGSSVLTHILSSTQSYRVKAITRNPDKFASPSGDVEVVSADLNDLESIKGVITGADYVFVVTDFWEHGTKTIKQGENVVDAIVKVAPDAVLLWSGLPCVSRISGNKFQKVAPFDTKAQCVDYAHSKSINIVDVQPASYFENLLTMFAPRKAEQDDTYILTFPMPANSRFAQINVKRDYGAFVVGAIESGMRSGELYACGDEPTGEEMAATWAKATGKKCTFKTMPDEVFHSMVGDEMNPVFHEMFQFFSEYGYYGGADIGPSLKMTNGVQGWKEFAETAKWKLV